MGQTVSQRIAKLSIEDGQRIAKLSIEDRVANGWRWLNENFPGWQSRIKISTLQLSDTKSCICGQVFAKAAVEHDQSLAPGSWNKVYSGYGFASDTLFQEANSWISTIVTADGYQRKARVAAALGFDFVGEYESPNVYDVLEAEWKRALKRYWRTGEEPVVASS